MVLSTISEVALLLMYICAMLLKTCTMSEDICSTFGFGEDASGEVTPPLMILRHGGQLQTLAQLAT